MRNIRPRITEQPREFPHAAHLRAVDGRSTSSTRYAPIAVRGEHLRFGPPGRPGDRIGRAEDHHHGHAERRGDVRRSAIVADEQRRARDQALDARQRFVLQDAKSCERREVVVGSGQEHRFQVPTIARRLPRIAIRRPGLIGRRSEGMDHGVRSRDPAAGSGKQFRARNLGGGTPSQNIADARCSAVCTLRSTPRISCARRNPVRNKGNCRDDARIRPGISRDAKRSAPCCAFRREDSGPDRRA